MPLPPSRFTWDARALRYRDARGQFVPRTEVRLEIDLAIQNAERRMAALAEQLRTNALSLDVWLAETRRIVKQIHLYSAAAAKGGWGQLAPVDFGRIGQIVREQYQFLEKFADQIVEGLPLDGRFLRRTALYVQAGRRTYHKTERAEMEIRGRDEERSILHPADHCDQCVEEADKDWQPLGSLIPIGERTCLGGCRCTFEYRTAA